MSRLLFCLLAITSMVDAADLRGEGHQWLDSDRILVVSDRGAPKNGWVAGLTTEAATGTPALTLVAVTPITPLASLGKPVDQAIAAGRFQAAVVEVGSADVKRVKTPEQMQEFRRRMDALLTSIGIGGTQILVMDQTDIGELASEVRGSANANGAFFCTPETVGRELAQATHRMPPRVSLIGDPWYTKEASLTVRIERMAKPTSALVRWAIVPAEPAASKPVKPGLPIIIRQEGMLRVLVEDPVTKRMAETNTLIRKLAVMKPEKIKKTIPGLNWKAAVIPWKSNSSIPGEVVAETSGTATDLTWPATAPALAADKAVAVIYEGLLIVGDAGLHRFSATGLDGVELRIGEQLVLTRAPGSTSGETAGGAALEPGSHRLRITVVRTKAQSTGATFGWKSGKSTIPGAIKASDLASASTDK